MMNAQRCQESKAAHTITLSSGYRSEFHEAQLVDDNIRQSCIAVEGVATETTRMATR